MSLSASLEDYLEVIYRLNLNGNHSVKITDLAKELACRRPTVTRSIQQLAKEGFVFHPPRKDIQLSPKGKELAKQLLHRHHDIHFFLSDICGLSRQQAEIDTCQIEHGFSPAASQQLHAFIEAYKLLPNAIKETLKKTINKEGLKNQHFQAISPTQQEGWRQ